MIVICIVNRHKGFEIVSLYDLSILWYKEPTAILTGVSDLMSKFNVLE